MLAYRAATLDAPSLAHVIRYRARTSLVISHGHSLPTLGTNRQALQQSRTFTWWSLLALCTECLSVVAQTLDVMLELFPSNIAFMRIANERSPLLGCKLHEGLAAIGAPACMRTTEAEGARVTRMMQDP